PTDMHAARWNTKSNNISRLSNRTLVTTTTPTQQNNISASFSSTGQARNTNQRGNTMERQHIFLCVGYLWKTVGLEEKGALRDWDDGIGGGFVICCLEIDGGARAFK